MESSFSKSLMNLTEEVAAYFGVPRDIEIWRFELGLAMRDPEGYSAALRTVCNADLYLSMNRIERATRGARTCIEYFVPKNLEQDFLDCLDELRERVALEAAARGVILVPANFSNGRPN